jgi:glycosyltransferase involved in cell wall biosynthesis
LITEPRFSVVVPLYNKASSIRRCISSILGQEFRDFELIVVNDGSTDDGPQIVRDITDSRVRLVDQDNAGPAAARNRGVSLAGADYVCFLDADDEWSSQFLQTMWRLRECAPGAGLYSVLHDVVGEDGKRYARKVALPQDYLGILEDFYRLYEMAELVNSSTACVRKELLVSLGGFPETARVGEDIYTWLRLADSGNVAFANVCHSTVYRNAENRSGNQPAFRMPFHLQAVLRDGAIEFSERNRAKVMRFAVRNGIVLAAAAAMQGQRKGSFLIAGLLYRHSLLSAAIAAGLGLTPAFVLRFAKKVRDS